jgi:putative sterol carrier protein
MDKPTTIEQLVQLMPAAFLPDKAKGVQAVIQLNLTGEGGGAWFVSIAEGKCEVSPGTAPTPTATITATAADYLAVGRGELNPMNAFMAGKIKATGNLGLLMNFTNWFAM